MCNRNIRIKSVFRIPSFSAFKEKQIPRTPLSAFGSSVDGIASEGIRKSFRRKGLATQRSRSCRERMKKEDMHEKTTSLSSSKDK